MFLTAPGVRENRSQVKPGRAVSELSTAHTSVITRPPAHLNPPNTHSSLSPKPTQRSTHSQQPVPTPAQPRQQRQRAEANLGGDHPTPSRIARKPHLPRASSARAGSLPRSPPSDPPIPAACPWSPSSLSLPLPNRGSSGNEPKRALEAITQPHRAQRESPTSPRASSARVGSLPRSHPTSDPPTPSSLSPHPNSLSLEPQQPVPTAPPATNWRPQLNAGFLDARERVRFPQSFGTNPEHVHEQHR